MSVVRSNQAVYFAPMAQPRCGRKKFTARNAAWTNCAKAFIAAYLKLAVVQTSRPTPGAQIEVKDLGVGAYQGRSGSGVRRWPALLCIAQSLLKLAATSIIKVPLPN